MRIHLCQWTSIFFILLLPSIGHSQVWYDRSSEQLSVRADNLPLTQILSEVGARTGIAFSISPSFDKPLSLEIRAMPLEDALKEIIKPLNNVFVYEGRPPKIIAVKIFAASSADAKTDRLPAFMLPQSERSQKKDRPTQAELEAMANKRLEKFGTPEQKREESERRRREAEEKAAWEAQEQERRAEQDKLMAAEREEFRKRVEGLRKSASPPDPAVRTSEPLLEN